MYQSSDYIWLLQSSHYHSVMDQILAGGKGFNYLQESLDELCIKKINQAYLL